MNYLDKVKHRNEKINETANKEDETLSILGLTLNSSGKINKPTNINSHNVFLIYMVIAVLIFTAIGAGMSITSDLFLMEAFIILPFAIIALAPYLLRKS